MPSNYDENGILRQWADDVTRTVTDYDSTGTMVGQPRAYTPEENAAADSRAAEAAAGAAREATRAAVQAIVVDLQAEKARVQPIIDKANAQITGADTKDVARAAKRIADAAIELARFVQNT